MRVWNLLATSTGGIDWAGLPVVVEWLGITDVEGLLARIEIIKLHGKDTDGHRNRHD